MYEATRHLNDIPEEGEPVAKLDGSVWHDKNTNELKWFDKKNGRWRRYYEDQFKRTSDIMSVLPPTDPVPGELWLNHGILCYWDGAAWHPVKADVQDGSQYSLDVFQNFMLMSPLQQVGDTVVADDNVEDYKKAERQYLQGILDAKTDSHMTGDGTKWYPGKKNIINAPSLPVFEADAKWQMVIPHEQNARVFIDHELTDKYEKVNECCIQMKKKDVYNHTPSLVHINPSRLSGIRKRLVKIDRANPKILIPPVNTEYYGFRAGDRFGDFLCPDREEGDGDYTVQSDGILLSFNASQDYDFVLAVTYSFMWMKATGGESHFDYGDKKTHFYVENYQGPNSLFVEGYSLEDPYFTEDSTKQIINVKEDTDGMSVSVLHVPKREYGCIRKVDSQNRGILHPVQHFDMEDSIVFINGQALSTQYDGVVFDGGYIYVPGAKEGMMWSVISLTDGDYTAKTLKGETTNTNVIDYAPDEASAIDIWERNEDGSIAYQKDVNGDYIYAHDDEGHVLYEQDLDGNFVYERDAEGNIVYELDLNGNKVLDSDGKPIPKKFPRKIRTLRIILFIDGLLVKNEDIIIDEKNHTLTVKGLHMNQEFIIIEDKKGWLYADKELCPAIPTGTLSESMVYYNNHLINNGTCVDTELDPEAVTDGIFNEVRYFIKRSVKNVPVLNDKGEPLKDINGDPLVEIQSKIISKEFRVYDPVQKRWNAVTENEAGPLEVTTHSYDNTPGGVSLRMGYDAADKIRVYAYKYANDIDHPLQVFNELVQDQDTIKTKAAYLPGRHTLKVWLNGIRQYPKIMQDDIGIEEESTGNYFKFPQKVTGLVTYIVELPEDGKTDACDVEVLDEKNILPGYVNMYRTNISLYPGRATVYVNGLRLPKENFTLLDNHTFIINGDQQLIGAANNFPREFVTYGDGKHKYIEHVSADKVLVEVRQDDRREQTMSMKDHDKPEIDLGYYKMSPAILEPADELVIYINGMYFGPKMNEGYELLPSRNTVLIQNEIMRDIMGQDIRVAIAKNEVELRDYYQQRGRELIPQADTVFTFEWR